MKFLDEKTQGDGGDGGGGGGGGGGYTSQVTPPRDISAAALSNSVHF